MSLLSHKEQAQSLMTGARIALTEGQEAELLNWLVTTEDYGFASGTGKGNLRAAVMRDFLPAVAGRAAVGTHTNRMNDGRNPGWLSFAPVALELEAGEYMFPLGMDGVNAQLTPYLKILLGPVMLDGMTSTTLAAGILSQRQGGKALVTDDVIKAPDTQRLLAPGMLDKELLFPVPGSANDYTAIFPVTPVSQPAVLRDAAYGTQSLLAASLEFTEKTAVRSLGRMDKLSKPQNFSVGLNSVGGQMFRPVLKVSRIKLRANFARQGIRELAQAANETLAQYRPTLRTLISETGAPNAAYLDRVFNAGVEVGALVAASLSQAVIDDAPPAAEITAHGPTQVLINALRAKSISADLAAQVLTMFPSKVEAHLAKYVVRMSAQPKFAQGIVEGLRLGQRALIDLPDVEIKAAAPGRYTPDDAETTRVRSLVVSFRADDVDLGSQSAFIGVPSMTAIYGFLHNLIERADPALKIRSIKPVFHAIDLGMHQSHLIHLFTPAQAETPAKGKGKAKAAEPARYSVFGSDPTGHPTSSVAASCEAKSTPLKKIINPTLVTSIKGSVDISLRVTLAAPIKPAVAERLQARLQTLSFAGGTLREGARVTPGSETRLGWTLEKSAVPVTPAHLSACFLTEAFYSRKEGKVSRREYCGEGQVTFVPVGYCRLHDRGILSGRKGITGHWAQTVYRFVRLAWSTKEDPAHVWSYESDASGRFIGLR